MQTSKPKIIRFNCYHARWQRYTEYATGRIIFTCSCLRTRPVGTPRPCCAECTQLPKCLAKNVSTPTQEKREPCDWVWPCNIIQRMSKLDVFRIIAGTAVTEQIAPEGPPWASVADAEGIVVRKTDPTGGGK
jgi:hypothetical protein